MIRRPPRSTQSRSSAASDVYKRQVGGQQVMSLRWLAAGVLVLSTALSFVDRQVLAALTPLLKDEFHLSNEGYGYIVSAFSLAYAVFAPVAGLFIDRVGLNLSLIHISEPTRLGMISY